MAGRYSVAKQFTFEQITPAEVWTIVHALGGFPIVDVLVIDPDTSQPIRILAEKVEYIDDSTVEVTFSTAQFGTARVMC